MKRFMKALTVIILNDALSFYVAFPFCPDIHKLTLVQWLLYCMVWSLVTFLLAIKLVIQHTPAKANDCEKKDMSID